MKIIQQGDLRRLDTVRRFECSACGCVWEACPAEYRREASGPNEWAAVCACPTCHKAAWNYGEGAET